MRYARGRRPHRIIFNENPSSKEVNPVNKLELDRIKKVGKKTIADFVRSETGSVGVKNAATIGAFAGMLALSQSSSEAEKWINHGAGTWELVVIGAM